MGSKVLNLSKLFRSVQATSLKQKQIYRTTGEGGGVEGGRVTRKDGENDDERRSVVFFFLLVVVVVLCSPQPVCFPHPCFFFNVL